MWESEFPFPNMCPRDHAIIHGGRYLCLLSHFDGPLSSLFPPKAWSFTWWLKDLFWTRLEALRKDSLHLLVICFWYFSLASFILLIKSLASSAASLFFYVCCFFRAIHQHLCYRTRGGITQESLGSLVLGLLPSLFKGFWQDIGEHHLLWRDGKAFGFCCLFGTTTTPRHSSMCQFRNILSAFFFFSQ